ncbi:hypothetical protein [Actinopolymorpha pittospori]|uniref:Uncharacterized protein n=1 Tax=Actinopolymorpha pittospori TaxID=648752 RepID=A0A927N701_9ACTN|nr:hypothetical protein [Actinopolymorpha pittospori]MBE1612143.1 hypothetical protein [Actinopolymorpha pittospori]
MVVRSYQVWGAACDSCDAEFETGHNEMPCEREDLADFGWAVDGDNALCPACAAREGARPEDRKVTRLADRRNSAGRRV